MADTDLERSEGFASSENIREQRKQRGQVLGMSPSAKFHRGGFVEFIAQNVFATRADKGVGGSGVHDEDEIGEVVDESASKFLLLVKLALHLAAGGNVQNGALIAKDAAGRIADRPGGGQAKDG